jgi:NTP pyrophosphatase (non-canonical NTP hydrolase)
MMQPNEYQRLAEATENMDFVGIARRFMDKKVIRLNHAAQGMATEVGEFTDVLKRWLHYIAPIDETNMAEEIGDLMWYVALACNALGVSLQDVMEKNNKKLRARYPDKFTEFDAQNRNLDVEREILEGKKDAQD